MSLTNYAEDLLLRFLIDSGAKFLSLHTVTPDEEGGGVEVSQSGYRRQQVTFSDPLDGAIANNNLIQFPPAGESWGLLTGFGIWDDPENGHMFWYGMLTDKAGRPVQKSVAAGDIFQVPVGDLTLILD